MTVLKWECGDYAFAVLILKISIKKTSLTILYEFKQAFINILNTKMELYQDHHLETF